MLRALPPVLRTACRPAEGRMQTGRFQQPAFGDGMVACQNEAPARPNQPRKLIKNVGRQDPPRRMPAFRPGVGKQNIGPGKRPCLQPAKNQPHIIVPDPDIAELALLYVAYQTGNAIDKGFGTDESGVGTRRGDGDKIFPPAKADLEEKVLRRAVKLWLCRMFGTETQLRKTLFQQIPHRRAESPALAATVEMGRLITQCRLRPVSAGRWPQTAAASVSARSTASQLNVPSPASPAVRPKCP